MSKSRKNISLAEVISILAAVSLIAAVLFPVLAQAEGNKVDEMCISNLKKIAQATLAYAEDWDGYGPQQTNHVYKSYWQGQLAKNLGYSGSELSNCWGAGGNKENADKYIKELQCPTRWAKDKISYGMNGNITMQGSAFGAPLKITELKHAAKTHLVSDADRYNVPYPDWLANVCNTKTVLSSTHNGGLNVAFCDGHVEFRNHGAEKGSWDYAKTGIIFRPGWNRAPK
jgi:prepilin-type processing-associated H-X9-DG protein